MSSIFEIYGTDAHSMTLQLMQAANVAAMIPKGVSVALKPNLVVASAPESGATTHPGVLSGCIEYLQSNGISEISIIESSWVAGRTDAAMKTCGYDRICGKYGVPFYDLKKDSTRTVTTKLRPMDITCRALDAGFLIDLPVLKGHGQTKLTCALKNLKGCLPDREKRHFHAMGLQKPIAALGAALKPRLIVVDSICGDLDFEEGGTPVQTNRMYLGTDAVQLDAYGRSLMGLNPEDVPYIEMCESFGGGKAEWSPEDITELNQPGASAAYPRPSGLVAGLTRHVHENQACSACYAALVRALYTSRCGEREEIYIGQGWQGKKLDGLGVGKCCQGAAECVMGCPPTAEKIAKKLENLQWS